MPIATRSERERVHHALCDGARWPLHTQLADDARAPAESPLERYAPTPESHVLRTAPPRLLTPAQSSKALATSVPIGHPLSAIHAVQSEREEAEEETSAAWRTSLEMADVFRVFGPAYRQEVGQGLTVQQDRVLRELMVCRSEVMGSHRWACERCGKEVDLFNSCKNRHCPKCGAYDRQLWASRVQADLLPIEYHHVVLTLPQPLTLLAMDHPRVLYPLLLRAGAEAILQLGREELEAELAVLLLPHSWGQVMNRHVHAHCLVSGGGLWLGGERFIQADGDAWLSPEKLGHVFRDRFLERLDRLYRRGELVLQGEWRMLDRPTAWEQFLEPLRTINWVAFSRGVWDRRDAAGKPDAVTRAIEYLARYANRTAMSNSRLLVIDGQDVLFRYKDHRDGGEWKTTSLPGVEFIGRFLRHLIPKGLRRIRRFGMWGNRVRTEKLALARRLLHVKPVEPLDEASPTEREEAADEPPDLELLRLEAEQGTPRTCRNCGGKMELLYSTRRPTVAELMQMPASMERVVETGPVQLHLPLSAFL